MGEYIGSSEMERKVIFEQPPTPQDFSYVILQVKANHFR